MVIRKDCKNTKKYTCGIQERKKENRYNTKKIINNGENERKHKEAIFSE